MSRRSVLRIDSIHLSSEAGGPQIVVGNRQKMLWAASLGVRVWVPKGLLCGLILLELRGRGATDRGLVFVENDLVRLTGESLCHSILCT